MMILQGKKQSEAEKPHGQFQNAGELPPPLEECMYVTKMVELRYIVLSRSTYSKRLGRCARMRVLDLSEAEDPLEVETVDLWLVCIVPGLCITPSASTGTRCQHSMIRVMPNLSIASRWSICKPTIPPLTTGITPAPTTFTSISQPRTHGDLQRTGLMLTSLSQMSCLSVIVITQLEFREERGQQGARVHRAIESHPKR